MHIEPVRGQIRSGVKIARLPALEATLELQLKNLVLSNLPQVMEAPKMDPHPLRTASPYFQNETRRQKACQIDLLIDTTSTVHLCAIRYGRRLGRSVADEVNDQAQRLRIRRGKSLRRVLIYLGELSSGLASCGAFEQRVPFERWLNSPHGSPHAGAAVGVTVQRETHPRRT